MPVDGFLSSLPDGHPIVARRALDGASAERCEAGQQWTWDDVRFTVLQPTAAHYAMPQRKSNDLSCVVRIESAHGSVLLTGDLEARGEQELVRRDAAVAQGRRAAGAASRQPHVVDAGVHRRRGSPTSRSMRPVTAIGSAIRDRTSSRATTSAGVRGYRTDLDGALTFTFAPDAPRVPRAEREHDRRYWREAPVREPKKALD